MTHAARRRLRALIVGGLLAVSRDSGLLASPPQPATAAPDLATTTFRAMSRPGQLVTDLTASEVEVRVDGRPRAIRSMEWVALAPASAEATASVAPAPPFGTNDTRQSGRAIILAIEDESFRPGRERPLREAIDRFLTALAPTDRVGVVTMPYGGFRLGFTTNHQRVRDEVNRIGGQGANNESGSDRACRTRRTIESLTGLVDGFKELDAPTTVVFVTSSMAGPRRDSGVTLAPGMCELTVDKFDLLGRAAGLGRADFYVVQPEDLIGGGSLAVENIAGVGFKGSDNPLEGIEHVSGVTGAERLHLASGGVDALVRVARETVGYYLVAFEPLPGDRNGASRQLDIDTTRPATQVRARPRLTMARPEAKDKKRAAVAPRTMLRDPRVFRDLPLRVTGYVSSRPNDDQTMIVSMAEPLDAGVKLAAAAAAVFNAEGALVAQWTAEQGELARTPLVGALTAPPGVYRLRVAATDESGRAGTADYDIDATLPSVGPVRVSGVVLGLSRGGFVPRMQFGSEPVVLAYVELYGGIDDTPVKVAADVSRTLDGPALVAVPGAVTVSSSRERRMATIAVPIGNLPPGDYAVRVLVGADGHPPARVVRTLRKVAPR